MTSFKTEVCSGSNYPLEVTRWIQEVEMATSLDDHETSPSITGQLVLNFDVALDAKIASSLKEIIQKNSNFRKRVQQEEEKAQKDDRFLRGRRIGYKIFEHFRVIGSHVAIIDYSGPFTAILRG